MNDAVLVFSSPSDRESHLSKNLIFKNGSYIYLGVIPKLFSQLGKPSIDFRSRGCVGDVRVGQPCEGKCGMEREAPPAPATPGGVLICTRPWI